MNSHPKVTVATSFAVDPPRGGGPQRVLGLYGALARHGIEIDVVTLVERSGRAGIRELAPGVREVRVPKSADLDDAERELQDATGIPVTDIALALHHDESPAYGDALAASARDAAAVVACHPFPYPALASATDAPLVYEAQDVELDLKARMLANAPELVDAVRDVEAACCAAADLVMVCSSEDGVRLSELYEMEPSQTLIVPNGADPATIEYVDMPARLERKRRLGLVDTFQAAFVGSWHEPNLVAVRDILAAAEALEEIRFLVVGSAGIPFAERPVPANVDLCGAVDARFLGAVLGLADVALNPMRWGSGTNLKMLEYALAGAPLASSAFGARGLGMKPGQHYVAAEPDDLVAALRPLRDEQPGRVAARSRAARDVTTARFGWSAIAARLYEEPMFRTMLEGIRL